MATEKLFDGYRFQVTVRNSSFSFWFHKGERKTKDNKFMIRDAHFMTLSTNIVNTNSAKQIKSMRM